MPLSESGFLDSKWKWIFKAKSKSVISNSVNFEEPSG